MDSFNAHLDLLVNDIKESDAYKTYTRLETELTCYYPELKREIDDFRAQNFKMQQNKNIDLFDEVDAFERRFYQLRKNPLANAYLEAELEVCHIIQEVLNEIRRHVHVGIPHLDD